MPPTLSLFTEFNEVEIASPYTSEPFPTIHFLLITAHFPLKQFIVFTNYFNQVVFLDSE